MTYISPEEGGSVAAKCDGPNCDAWTYTPTDLSWLAVEWLDSLESATFDFCSWECAMKFGARIEPNVIVP